MAAGNYEGAGEDGAGCEYEPAGEEWRHGASNGSLSQRRIIEASSRLCEVVGSRDLEAI